MTGRRSCVRVSISATSSDGNLCSNHRRTIRIDDFYDTDAEEEKTNNVGRNDQKEKVSIVVIYHSMHFYLSLIYINSSHRNLSRRAFCLSQGGIRSSSGQTFSRRLFSSFFASTRIYSFSSLFALA